MTAGYFLGSLVAALKYCSASHARSQKLNLRICASSRLCVQEARVVMPSLRGAFKALILKPIKKNLKKRLDTHLSGVI